MKKLALSKLQRVHCLSPSPWSPSQEPGSERPSPFNQPGAPSLRRLHHHSTRFLSCIIGLHYNGNLRNRAIPDCAPLRRLCQDPVREYARRDPEETDAEMRDDLVDSPFIQVDSASQSLSPDRDSPLPRGRLALSGGVHDTKAMDDSESRRPSFYQASRPTPVANDDDAEFSLMNAGGFTGFLRPGTADLTRQ